MDDVETADGWYTAVVDRIEAGEERGAELAVLVLEREGDAVGELVAPLAELPPLGRMADSVLCVRLEAGELAAATLDTQETASRRERARSRFERLSRRLPERAGRESDDDSNADE
ncbi:DUF3006 family protein [Halogranum rubrum]|uniref:DUF3006 domain-containing protein n=1 Tax=Halogranum salarium B-1 TaxID=1210908 RepID=J2ZKZ6_9EURY|nr:DUF3006 family protein [Halogranum salarium]EJN61400.1 hypothetical protein HSB1_04410 [Halogranum salarium B-1]